MARPVKPKLVREAHRPCCYRPQGEPASGMEVVVSVEELEALRLVDLEGLYQQDAAAQMEISRPTLQRMVNEARAKLVGALVTGSVLRIEGGNYILRKSDEMYRCGRCGKQFARPEREKTESCRCPACDHHRRRAAGCPRQDTDEQGKEEL